MLSNLFPTILSILLWLVQIFVKKKTKSNKKEIWLKVFLLSPNFSFSCTALQFATKTMGKMSPKKKNSVFDSHVLTYMFLSFTFSIFEKCTVHQASYSVEKSCTITPHHIRWTCINICILPYTMILCQVFVYISRLK